MRAIGLRSFEVPAPGDLPHPGRFLRRAGGCERHAKRLRSPARQTRRPKRRQAKVYRLTLNETVRFLAAATSTRERRIAYLGVCAGLRREEIRLLQGKHLARDGWVWVSQDIAKGGRERWVPVIGDLEPIVVEILRHVGPEEYVIPAQRYADPPRNTLPRDRPGQPGDAKTIWRTVKRVANRAGPPEGVTPHTMRHAFADHTARSAGLRSAQMMLGHAALSTTEGYLGAPTLDELAEAVRGVRFALPPTTTPESRSWRRRESNPRPRTPRGRLLRA